MMKRLGCALALLGIATTACAGINPEADDTTLEAPVAQIYTDSYSLCFASALLGKFVHIEGRMTREAIQADPALLREDITFFKEMMFHNAQGFTESRSSSHASLSEDREVLDITVLESVGLFNQYAHGIVIDHSFTMTFGKQCAKPFSPSPT